MTFGGNKNPQTNFVQFTLLPFSSAKLSGPFATFSDERGSSAHSDSLVTGLLLLSHCAYFWYLWQRYYAHCVQ